METISIKVSAPEALQDLLIDFLGEWSCEAFLQEEDHIQAFLPAEAFNPALMPAILDWQRAQSLPERCAYDRIPHENWNARWEASIQPIEAGDFVVAPTWASLTPEQMAKRVIRIDPKMSFGTGHHESTRLILRFLPRYIKKDDTVLDAGTGTGILAIASLRLGASHALAFDNDDWVTENVVENFELNHVAYAYEFRVCGMEGIVESGFDVIIANIQRNILLEMMPDFAAKVRPKGYVLLAGLLTETDKEPILASAAAHGFTPVDEATERQWWSVVLQAKEA